jgi:hypothetical protein
VEIVEPEHGMEGETREFGIDVVMFVIAGCVLI